MAEWMELAAANLAARSVSAANTGISATLRNTALTAAVTSPKQASSMPS